MSFIRLLACAAALLLPPALALAQAPPGPQVNLQPPSQGADASALAEKLQNPISDLIRLCGQTGPDARGADGGLVGATAAWPRGGELID